MSVKDSIDWSRVANLLLDNGIPAPEVETMIDRYCRRYPRIWSEDVELYHKDRRTVFTLVNTLLEKREQLAQYSFEDIPQLYFANYRVTMSWDHVEHTLKSYTENYGLDLEPDFQRCRDTWSDDRRTAYVEYILAGGPSAREIQFNCPHWMGHTLSRDMVLVDGLQRLTAVRRFLANELPAYGRTFRQYGGRMSMTGPSFLFFVNNLLTRQDVLLWYLQLNKGGVAHTPEELAKVERLLKECQET